MAINTVVSIANKKTPQAIQQGGLIV